MASTGRLRTNSQENAQHVMNFFGDSERIIDNILEPEDRTPSISWRTPGSDHERGDHPVRCREWRIHYYSFRRIEIFSYQHQRQR
jgi:hypothetical protein